MKNEWEKYHRERMKRIDKMLNRWIQEGQTPEELEKNRGGIAKWVVKRYRKLYEEASSKM